MSIVDLHVELQWMRPLLERLVTAAERIAGPPPVIQEPPRQAILSDYSYIPDDEFARIEHEKDQWARQHNIVPGSEAFMKGVEEYEQQIIASYGEFAGQEIIEALPWKQRQPTAPNAG